jgi:hypothetical protein
MPRTTFTTKHFLACLAVSWEGSPGAKTRRTLEGVGYNVEMGEGVEPPFVLSEIWFFARFYRTGDSAGPRRFRIVQRRTHNTHSVPKVTFELGDVSFVKPDGVVDVAWPIRSVEFRAGGQYEFRLQSLRRTKLGLRWKTESVEYLGIEERR